MSSVPYSKGWNSVRRKPSGKWEARWADESGNARGLCFITKEQAAKYAFARAKEILDGATGLAVPTKNLQDAITSFLNRYTDEGTLEIYTRHLTAFTVDHPLIIMTGRITRSLIEAYDADLTRRGHNPGGRRHILKTIKTFTNYCMGERWIMENPFGEGDKRFKAPKSEFEGRALTPEESERLTGGDRETDWFINRAVRLARSTMRRSRQIWGLVPESFREPGLLYFPSIKGQEAQWLPLQPEAIQIIRELMAHPERPAPDARFFFRWNSVEHLRDAIRVKAIDVGLKGTRLHDAGKVTRVTELDAAGKGLGYISAVSGTSQETLSRHYIKPDRRKAFEDYLSLQTYGRPTEALKPTETAPQPATPPAKSNSEIAQI